MGKALKHFSYVKISVFSEAIQLVFFYILLALGPQLIFSSKTNTAEQVKIIFLKCRQITI